MSTPMDTAAAGGSEAEAASAAGTAPPWWEKWGERLNPLVVKEVRQGLRTRIFWVCFGLMLLACVVLSLIAYVETREAEFARHGRGFFFAYFVCLGVVHFFVIPYNAYRSLAREREDETWVLLVLTGLGPRRILRGKVASFLVQAGLYASAVGPFLLFSYYLNGIDLPTILTVLALGGAWLVFLTLVSVCAATLADGRLGRAFIHFALLGALGMAVVQGLVAAYAMSEMGDRMLRDEEFLYAAGIALGLMLTDGWLLFEAAASRLSMATEDYTRGPRRALVGQVVLVMLAGGAVWWAEGLKDNVPQAFGLVGMVHLTAVGLFVATDLDGQARPLRAATRPWSLLRPGALRGFRLVVLLLVAWAGLWGLLQELSLNIPSGNDEAAQMATLAGPAYAILFISLALLLGRMPRSDRLSSPVAVRLLFIMVVGVASALPPLVAVLLGLEGDDPLINLLNPVVGTVNFGTHSYTHGLKMDWALLYFLLGVAALAAFGADRVLAEREKRAHAS